MSGAEAHIFNLIEKKEWGALIEWIKSHSDDSMKLDRNGQLPIHAIFCHGKGETPFDCVKALLEAHPDGIKATSSTGKLPLHLALFFGDTSMNIEIIKLLLERCREATYVGDNDVQLPLHLAGKCSIEVVAAVIEAYPQACKVQDCHGCLPIHRIFYYGRGETSLECVRILLDACPDSIKAKTNRGELIIHFALYFGDRRMSVDIIKLLLERHKDAVHIGDEDKRLPLHLAGKCSSQVVTAVIEADPEACKVRACNGWLPLHCFVYFDGNEEAVMTIINAYPEALLIPDNKGNTPKQLVKSEAIRKLLLREEGVLRAKQTNTTSLLNGITTAAVSDNEDEPAKLSSGNDVAKPHVVVKVEDTNETTETPTNEPDKQADVSYDIVMQPCSQPNQPEATITSANTTAQPAGDDNSTSGNDTITERLEVVEASVQIQELWNRTRGGSIKRGTYQAKIARLESARSPSDPLNKLPYAIADRESMFGLVPAPNQSFLDRIGAVEVAVFGESQKGWLMPRIDALFNIDQKNSAVWEDLIAQMEKAVGIESVVNKNIAARVEGLERAIWGDEYVEAKNKNGYLPRLKELADMCNVVW
mmetsp:Transcript_52025/g.62608  ORF Transcript_52025/g.62608 Transcript_52025/m.62608 type:complete len:590 (+) Transcript_52025:259-2028(+)|eukprot:CAMPEP_0172509032 /NCGR_PEP_ID=MMETSP1066-20121228/217059_1 /TAXON_ID=671091 /ORGANISM="Coscinodiscus wailesii, Strain CCMP2513" /LENGTH=589 /DNA_ID=CAMNT_0013287335 /DNA_START=258 /DNA_END=2024 /DNA_ORIENTATION=+